MTTPGDLGLRAAQRTRRWRLLTKATSVSLGIAALASAVVLGVGGPLTSPVAASPAAASVADDAGAAAQAVVPDRGQGRGGQDRGVRDGFGRHGR